MDVDKATQTQLDNIQKKTGKTLDELFALVRSHEGMKHGELRDKMKDELGIGHGDANTLVHFARKEETGPDVLGEIYTGPKEGLRPIHDALMSHIDGFGEFEVAPKKGYVSLRRKKQFAMIGPATNSRVEVGLNMKGIEGTSRLEQRPPGEMCQYKVKVTDAAEVDAELVGWLRTAFDSAG